MITPRAIGFLSLTCFPHPVTNIFINYCAFHSHISFPLSQPSGGYPHPAVGRSERHHLLVNKHVYSFRLIGSGCSEVRDLNVHTFHHLSEVTPRGCGWEWITAELTILPGIHGLQMDMSLAKVGTCHLLKSELTPGDHIFTDSTWGPNQHGLRIMMELLSAFLHAQHRGGGCVWGGIRIKSRDLELLRRKEDGGMARFGTET